MSKWTWIVIIAAVVLWLGYDIFDFIKDPSGNTTISWQIYQASLKTPFIPFCCGVLAGHLFAGMHGE